MSKKTYSKIDQKVIERLGIKKAYFFNALRFRFERHPDGFYKFKKPCKHRSYKIGDSWSEELCMKRSALDAVHKDLVNHHKSKTAYTKSTDKFAGKMFCSYTSRNTNMTFYFIDKEAVDAFLLSVTGSIPKAVFTPPTPEIDALPECSKSLPYEALGNVENQHSFTCARLNTNTNTQTNTSLIGSVSGSPPTESENEKSKLVSKEMVNTWNSLLDDNVVWFSSHTAKLCKALDESFGGNIEKFKEYCQAIVSSQFLTGKSKSSFKAVLFWVIKSEIVQGIKLGAYGVTKSFSMPVPDKPKYEIRSADSLQEEILEYNEPKDTKAFRATCLAIVGNAKYISYFKKLKVEFKDDNVVLTAATKFEATCLESNCAFYLPLILEKLGKKYINILSPGDVRGSWIEREKPSIAKERTESYARTRQAVAAFKKINDMNQLGRQA